MSAIRKLLFVLVSATISQISFATDALPQPEPSFKGRIAISAKDSVPDWAQPAQAPQGAPNIVVILLDDIGFADTSTFGGLAQTPQLSQLAATGLRYNNFHTTGLCAPTRAALLAGRNQHRVGFGFAEMPGGYPGYDYMWKKSAVSLPEVLRRNGYSTAAFGKWHNTAGIEISPVGPFDRWPTSLGFEYFYGFMAGADSEWEPSLFRDTTPIPAPATPQEGYHLTTDLVDQATRWLQTHESLAPTKPYFLYFAPGAVHEPHHAPQEWIDEYRGRFDEGWDALRQEIFARQKTLHIIPANAELTPRPKEIPAWESLSADQKTLYARQMEVYAGFIAHTDHEIGRLLSAVQHAPGADNTLILYIVGDNGAGGESGLNGITDGEVETKDQLTHIDELGGPKVAANSYSVGWAWVGSTPFQWWKGIASHFGATRNPLVVSWPGHIRDLGGLRTQFTHVNDVAATIYDLTGVHFPTAVDGVKQRPLDGLSFAQTFNNANAASRHRTQYFESWGNRAIYRDGWIAAARHVTVGFWKFPLDFDYTNDRWELYHVQEDFSEARDLASVFPDRLKALRTLFDTEARKNDVYPLGGGIVGWLSGDIPSLTANRREFVYHVGMPRLQRTAIPPLLGKSYRISASAMIPESGAEGVILTYGGRAGGFALYVKGGRLIYENNPSNQDREVITSDVSLPKGNITLAFDFSLNSTRNGPSEEGGSGTGRLWINGQEVGSARLSIPGNFWWSRSLSIGQEFGSPVSDAFTPPFRFTGTLQQVKVELK